MPSRPRAPDPYAAYRGVAEEDFQRHVIAAIRWVHGDRAIVYHTHRSDHSEAGFPDILAIIPDARPLQSSSLVRQIAWELKGGGKRTETTRDQLAWLHGFTSVGADARVIYPWDMDTVIAVLTGQL